MKITYSAAASRDGFIAREDGDVSWLDELGIDPESTGLDAFFASVDGLVMGRRTYDFVFDYGSWPYEDKPTWVCTSRELEPLDGANLIVVEEIGDVVRDATERCLTHLWLLGGGRLASSFLSQGLINHVSIAEMPITLGSGIPLFAEHELDTLRCSERQTVQKDGFRQIEIVLADDAV